MHKIKVGNIYTSKFFDKITQRLIYSIDKKRHTTNVFLIDEGMQETYVAISEIEHLIWVGLWNFSKKLSKEEIEIYKLLYV